MQLMQAADLLSNASCLPLTVVIKNADQYKVFNYSSRIHVAIGDAGRMQLNLASMIGLPYAFSSNVICLSIRKYKNPAVVLLFSILACCYHRVRLCQRGRGQFEDKCAHCTCSDATFGLTTPHSQKMGPATVAEYVNGSALHQCCCSNFL